MIGADTVVAFKEKILEKPADIIEAEHFLRMLSDEWHKVYTGVTMIHCLTGKKYQKVLVTEVRFRALSDIEIENYLSTYEWTDKAGGYGIQGVGSILVEQIQGDFFNVMGLSPLVVYQGLQSLGYDVLKHSRIER